jgi:hypothetical protein
LTGLGKGYIFVGEGPGIRNCNKAGCGSIRVSRLIFMVIKIIKYLVISVIFKCVLKKKQMWNPAVL